jgi:hypothetical protein
MHVAENFYTTSKLNDFFRFHTGKDTLFPTWRKIHLLRTWCRNFLLRAFSDTRTEIISNRAYLNFLHCKTFFRTVKTLGITNLNNEMRNLCLSIVATINLSIDLDKMVYGKMDSRFINCIIEKQNKVRNYQSP